MAVPLLRMSVEIDKGHDQSGVLTWPDPRTPLEV